jgi:Tfp pilus assembly protein PilN
MIEINLIPTKVKKQKQMQRVYFLAVFGAGAIIAVGLGIVLYQQSRINKIEAEIRRIDAESASLQDKIEEVKKFRAKEDTYNKKKAVIDKLMADQSLWTEILDNIGEIILPDMWLTSLTQDRMKDEGPMVRISGGALSKNIVADFIKRLEHDPKILQLTAAQIGEEQSTAGLITVKYEISFVYKIKP